ncbi:tRNA-specific 2-thiouridylase [Sporobacter termitidis DSM 10068]|uniref:tRNA-specific 2-thiouridylase MnmA n=1 Tax=Sporobacter termitidis DSM 10068 TaxID=1123282 RepID=A0A1M5Z203_9FIRM|nr:tRNA 2-thiouridine(34) synthase MnmA [Sporobacter termitidis]SHI18108.1 tRNA-specific 2-thiouridylase [Sporobacter termitidis DSM 10068]
MTQSVMIAMSGGVDSSVAAVLLLEQGCRVVGATLKLFSNDDIGLDPSSRTCCSLSDVEDARSVAYRLNIDHFVFNFGDEFNRDVIARFAEAYLQGRTPNPCIDCNRFIKFDKLLERARLLGVDHIATGHYAQVARDENTGRWLLKKSADASKDQTYVLAALTQEQLSRTLFPLGGLTKGAVRAIAAERGLINAKKPDSQDICFVPDGDYAAFIENVLGYKSVPGNFTDSAGRVLGTHKGIIHYTIGQRRGLGLAADRPKYVIGKDLAANTVVVGDEEELYSPAMTVGDLNLIAVESIPAPMRATVKTRYSQKETPATLYPPENGRMTVVFDRPQRAVTSGQAAVFYDGDTVLGGGTIV